MPLKIDKNYIENLLKKNSSSPVKTSVPTKPITTPVVPKTSSPTTASAVVTKSNGGFFKSLKDNIMDAPKNIKYLGGIAKKNLTAPDAGQRFLQAEENLSVGAGKAALGTVQGLANLGSKVSGRKNEIDLPSAVFPDKGVVTGVEPIAQKVGGAAYKLASSSAFGSGAAGFGAAGGFSSMTDAASKNKSSKDIAIDTAAGVGTGLALYGAGKVLGKGWNALRSLSKGGSSKVTEVATKEAGKLIASPEEVTQLRSTAKELTNKLRSATGSEKDVLRSSLDDINNAISESVNVPSVKPSGLLRSGGGDIVGKSSISNNSVSSSDNGTFKTGVIDKLRSEKGFLRKFGKFGNDIADRVESFESRSDVKGTTAVNKFNDVYDRLFPKSSGKTNLPVVDNNKNIVDFIVRYDYARSKGLNLPSVAELPSREQEVVRQLFKTTGEPSSLAIKQGILGGGETGKPDLFLPHIIKDIDKLKAFLKGKGMSYSEINSTVNNIRVNKFAGFEKERSFFPQSFEELKSAGYETDLKNIVARWSPNAWKRVEGAVHFGGKGFEEVKNGVNTLVMNGNMSSAEGKAFIDNFNRAVSGRVMDTEGTEKAVGVAKKLLSTKLGITSGIKQPQSLSQTAAIAGVRNTLKGVFGSKSPADKEIVRNSGVLLNRIVRENIKGEESGLTNLIGGKTLKVIDKVADANITISGVPKLDSMTRTSSAYAGLEWIRDSMKRLASGKLSTNEFNILKGRIKDFAIPISSKIDQIISGGGHMTDEEMAVAVNKFVEKTQFGARRSNLPNFVNNTPAGELFSVLKTYSYEGAAFTTKLLSMAKERGDVAPLIKYLVGIGVTSVPTSLALAAAKNRWDEVSKVFMETVGNQLGGAFVDTLDNVSSDWGPRVAGVFGGVVGSEVADLVSSSIKSASNVKESKNNPLSPLEKYAHRRTISKIPYFGPKNYEDTFGSSSSKPKKSPINR